MNIISWLQQSYMFEISSCFFFLERMVYNKSNTMGVTCGTTYPSGAPEFISGF